MGSYIASDRSIAAARASGAQHRSMNPTQSLEKAADAFLSDAERNMPACTDVWTAAAGLYGTEGEDGELAWQAEALCAQTDPRSLLPREGRLHPRRQKGMRCMPRARRMSTICNGQ